MPPLSKSTTIAIHSSFPTLIALMTSVTRVKHVVTQTKTFTDPGPAGPLSIQSLIAVANLKNRSNARKDLWTVSKRAMANTRR